MSDLPLDIELVLELGKRISWTPEQLADHRTERLRALLLHATTHSPFWRKRLDGLDPASANVDDLARIPVLTKDELMAHWDEIVTVPGLTLDRCRRHMDALPEDPGPKDRGLSCESVEFRPRVGKHKAFG